MLEQIKCSPNIKEIPPFGYPVWLAGFLEIGGSMYFEKMNIGHGDRFVPYARPIIKMGDHDPIRVETLNRIMNGETIDRSKPKTLYVRLRCDKAVWLANSIRGYAPSRENIIQAFQLWSEAESTEDRVEIAKPFYGRRTVSEISPSVYRHLVRDSNFVAGLIDGRGSVIYDNANQSIDNFRLSSINTALLYALRNQYGGYVDELSHAGDTVFVRGTDTTMLLNNNSQWVIGRNFMNELVAWAKPRLPLSNA